MGLFGFVKKVAKSVTHEATKVASNIGKTAINTAKRGVNDVLKTTHLDKVVNPIVNTIKGAEKAYIGHLLELESMAKGMIAKLPYGEEMLQIAVLTQPELMALEGALGGLHQIDDFVQHGKLDIKGLISAAAQNVAPELLEKLPPGAQQKIEQMKQVKGKYDEVMSKYDQFQEGLHRNVAANSLLDSFEQRDLRNNARNALSQITKYGGSYVNDRLNEYHDQIKPPNFTLYDNPLAGIKSVAGGIFQQHKHRFGGGGINPFKNAMPFNIVDNAQKFSQKLTGNVLNRLEQIKAERPRPGAFVNNAIQARNIYQSSRDAVNNALNQRVAVGGDMLERVKNLKNRVGGGFANSSGNMFNKTARKISSQAQSQLNRAKEQARQVKNQAQRQADMAKKQAQKVQQQAKKVAEMAKKRARQVQQAQKTVQQSVSTPINQLAQIASSVRRSARSSRR